MATLTVTLLSFTFLLLCYNISPIRSQQATVTAYCDNRGEVLHSNGGSFTIDAQRMDDPGTWGTAITATISVSEATTVRVICYDEGHTGGMIGQVTYEGQDYYTTNPMTAGYWRVISAEIGNTTSLSYWQVGSGPWGGCCSLMNSNAYWLWNGQDGDTIVFDLDMSLLPVWGTATTTASTTASTTTTTTSTTTTTTTTTTTNAADEDDDDDQDEQLICEDGYTCYEDSARDVVWVKRDDGNDWGPTCQQVCGDALLNNNVYHACDATQPIITDTDSFSDIAQGLNFRCKSGGYKCWDSAPGTGMILVTRGSSYIKNCYFPSTEDPDDDDTTTLQCKTSPGNANCFGERFSTICPCTPKALDEACVWENPPNIPEVATFDYSYAASDTDTSCITRINYWRKRACDEGWIECPPQGLPPMTECTCCHDCANSQAEYDKAHGPHASHTRCGDMAQGEGGGENCASVIDGYVREERTADENGILRCQGHCAPIVMRGCQTFFWGEYQGFYTLNWGTCNTDRCTDYCRDPTHNECFSSAADIAPNIAQCEAYESMAFTHEEDSDRGPTISLWAVVILCVLVIVAVIGAVYCLSKRRSKKFTQLEEEDVDKKGLRNEDQMMDTNPRDMEEELVQIDAVQNTQA